MDWWEQVINPDPTRLAELKQKLKETLAVVEAKEKEVYDAMRPKSAAEVQLLEQHLTAALDSLRAGHKG